MARVALLMTAAVAIGANVVEAAWTASTGESDRDHSTVAYCNASDLCFHNVDTCLATGSKCDSVNAYACVKATEITTNYKQSWCHHTFGECSTRRDTLLATRNYKVEECLVYRHSDE